MQLQINQLLFSMSKALDCVEQEMVGVTTNHSKRVAFMCMRLCKYMGYSEVDTFDMASCAILHDNALTEYSLREGRHNAQYLKNIEFHCTSGEENAKNFPFFGRAENIILHHHENWDGSGYFRLKGRETGVRAAMLRLADHCDQLFGMSHGAEVMLSKVRAHVQASKGILYDPEVADAFMDIANQDLVYELSSEKIDQSVADLTPMLETRVRLEDILRVCAIFSGITDAKSPHTSSHCRGVAEKTCRCAEAYGYGREHVMRLTIAAHLHDVGKLSTPPSVLEKTSALSPQEFEIMRGHVRMTHEILAPVGGMEQIVEWAASHHEKLNGTGYHRGINADRLDPESRILACVDVYQALREDRPYRKGMPHAQATEIMYRMVRNGSLDKDMVQLVDHTLGSALVPPRTGSAA